MQSLREQAQEFINTLPDDKIVYLMDMFKGIQGFMNEPAKDEKQARQMLLEDIKGLRGIVRSDIDEKAELESARIEKQAKYESLN